MSNRAFVPSPQQATFFDWIVNGKGNAIIQAVAGSGKTTTLLHGMAKMTGTVLYIVFNKANELEAKAKLARMGVKAIAKTFHSLGYSALRRVCPKAKMDNKKTFLVMDSLKIPQEFHAFVRKAVTLAKNRALGCDGFGSLNDRSQWAAIVDRFDLVQELDDTTPLDVAIDYAIQTLIKSNDMLRELVDFDDMIYGCIYLGVTLFQNDWVVVDEGQDTNASRRALIRMALNRKGRAAFVGDVAQAIYGFTGADAESFEILKKEFNCQELPLTVTYRCPKAVVDVAKGYVPAIEAHESAIDGVVTSVDVESFDPSTLSKDDAILCRKTKPLIELAYSLIKKNIP